VKVAKICSTGVAVTRSGETFHAGDDQKSKIRDTKSKAQREIFWQSPVYKSVIVLEQNR